MKAIEAKIVSDSNNIAIELRHVYHRIAQAAGLGDYSIRTNLVLNSDILFILSHDGYKVSKELKYYTISWKNLEKCKI